MNTFNAWLKAAGIRAIKTMCQTAIALIGTELVAVYAVDWVYILSVAVTAGLLSILTSCAGLPEVQAGETNE